MRMLCRAGYLLGSMLLLAAWCGCSGGGNGGSLPAGNNGGSIPGDSSGTGSVVFQIIWPAPTKLLPIGAQVVIIYLDQGVDNPLGWQESERPANGGTSAVVFPSVPGGVNTYRIEVFTQPPPSDRMPIPIGVANGTVTVCSGQRASISVNTVVQSQLASALIATTGSWNFSVSPGGTLQLVAGGFDTFADVLPLPADSWRWSSSNPAVAMVDANSGLVTGVTVGKTTITVTDRDTGIHTSQMISVGDSCPGHCTGWHIKLLPARSDTGTLSSPVSFSVILWKGEVESSDFVARWDFTGSGHFATPFSAAHAIDHQYTRVGLYTPRVQVKLPDGETFTDQETIEIDELATPAYINLEIMPTTAPVGASVTFLPHVWDTDDEVPPQWSLRWDWENDGCYDTPLIPVAREDPNGIRTFSHRYTTPGIKIVRVQWGDNPWTTLGVIHITAK